MFITLEGIEGAGKGTMLEFLRTWLTTRHDNFLFTKEPGGSRLGAPIREILLNSENNFITARAELFMYLADRAQHVEEIIRPALLNKTVVISDRYADSNIVYQGYGRGLDPEKLFLLNDEAVGSLWPDITILLDIDPEKGLLRARQRNEAAGLTQKEGRYEAEDMEFHHRIRNGYLEWAEKHSRRIKVVKADDTPEQVFEAVAKQIYPLLN